jgi:hypothetical protein
MQKKTSTIKFEPSNLFYLTRQTPHRNSATGFKPSTLASIEALRLDSNPPTLASIEALRLDSNPLYLIVQKKNSAIKFEPSNLFSNPIEALRLDSNPLPYHAGFEPFTLLCIKKL